MAKAKSTPSFAVQHKKLSDFAPDKRNANRGTERGAKAIAQSLKDFGAGRSILLDKHGNIIAGNKTAQNAGAAGMGDVLVVQTDGTKLVAVQRMDLDLADVKAKGLAIADNRAGELSLDWDPEVLESFASEIDLSPYFSKDELAALMPAKELLTDEDDVPETPVTPVTQVGDLYVMGEHRLLCGDSTVLADVERLMDGQKADMVFTDPPYGVSIVNARGQVEDRSTPGPALRKKALGANTWEKNALKSGTDGAAKPFGKKGVGGGDNIIKANLYSEVIGDDSTETAIAAFNLCASLHIETMIFWGGNYYADKLPPSSCWVVWDKDNGQSFFADAELAWTNRKTAVRIFKHQWNGLLKASERGEKRVHPTQKPVALAAWCFDNYGAKGESILDLFGGSGSTLIACEKTGRRCYMMELSPSYVDVIVARWENATGKKAVLHGAA